MDDLERRLIAELRINSRASTPQLAQILGVARATVQKRMDRLIAAGVIKGFTVRLKDDLKENQVRAFVLIALSSGNIKVTVARIKRIPGIAMVYNTNGFWDVIAELEVPGMPELNNVISAVREMEGVQKSETFIMLGPA